MRRSPRIRSVVPLCVLTGATLASFAAGDVILRYAGWTEGDPDPSSSIGALRRVRFVMKGASVVLSPLANR